LPFFTKAFRAAMVQKQAMSILDFNPQGTFVQAAHFS
jgi:hypothetical protein